MSPIRRIYGGAQVCAPEGRDSSHSGEPIIYGRATRALLSIWVSIVIWILTFGICWGNYKNLEVKDEDNI